MLALCYELWIMKYTLQIFSMEADTGDFRTSERLLLVKRLSQATCCTAHIILNSVILHNTHSGREECVYTDHMIADVRKYLNARPGICPFGCQHLISFSLSTKGVASFICLHNCRPACLCVWHIVVKSTTLLLSNRRSLHKITPFFSTPFFFASHFSLTLARDGNENH